MAFSNFKWILFQLSGFFLFCSRFAFASELRVLNKNDILKLPVASSESVAVEKKDLLIVKDRGRELWIQGKKEGDSLLRIGARTFHLVVTSSTLKDQYEQLKQVLGLNKNLSLDYREGRFRVRGQLDDASTWLTLSSLNINCFSMEAEFKANDLRLIEYSLNKLLVNSGFFPVRIFMEPFPTVRLPKLTSQNPQLVELISQFGVNIKTDSQRLPSERLVRVQVQLIEARKSQAQQIGLEWPSQFAAKVLPTGLIPVDPLGQVTAHFFTQRGLGRILASPVLLAKSGSEADFFAGGEFPIKTKTKQTQTVVWKKYGIGLKIKPLADPDGKISLELKSEVSTIDSGEKIEGIPSLFTNTLATHFDLQNNQTIVLSGLVKKIGGESLKLWPGLGDIPILGTLFTSRDYQEDKTELLVLVTPTIILQE